MDSEFRLRCSGCDLPVDRDQLAKVFSDEFCRRLEGMSSFDLESDASSDCFKAFVRALNGGNVDVTSSTCDGVRRLCQETGFTGLNEQLTNAEQMRRLSMDFAELKKKVGKYDRNLADEVSKLDEKLNEVQTTLEESEACFSVTWQDIEKEIGLKEKEMNDCREELNELKKRMDAELEALSIYVYATSLGVRSAKGTGGSGLFFKKAGKCGNSYALTTYGHWLMDGLGMKKDVKKAAKYYKMAADKGNVPGMSNYGSRCMLASEDEGRDYRAAVAYFQKALKIDPSNTYVRRSFAICLENGWGIPLDLPEAARQYKISADAGNPFGQGSYAMCLQSGKGVEKDVREAVRYFKMCNVYGHPDEIYTLAEYLEKGESCERDMKYAVELYKKSADKSNANAMCKYAAFLENGTTVEIDLPEAARYYKKAADRAFSVGYNNYARCLSNGIGVTKDLNEAARYYGLAAAAGCGIGRVNYGRCLEQGIGIEQNKMEAVKNYELSAKQGNIDGMLSYGRCLEYGIGIDRDVVQAANFYKKAADDKGASPEAQRRYGLCCECGQGVQRRRSEAVRYYKLADKGGDSRAQALLNRGQT